MSLWTSMPPAAGSPAVYYEWLRQFPEAIRDKFAALYGNFNWPPGTRVWASGKISSITVDPDDDTYLRVTCTNDAGASQDWIGDRATGDGPDKKWWTNYSNSTYTYLPTWYKVAIYPTTICSSGSSPPIPGKAEDGHVLEITDNGLSYLRVKNDGVLTNLRGKSLSYYTGFSFDIHKSGVAIEKAGYSWLQRFPPKPNDEIYEWGRAGKAMTVTATAPDQFTLTIGANTTTPIAVPATSGAVQSAIAALPGISAANVAVIGDAGGAGGPFTAMFAPAVGDVTMTGTGATVTVIDNVIADIKRTFDPLFVAKHVVFQIGDEWKRVPITVSIGSLLTFASLGTKPNVNSYYAVIDVLPAFWRPHIGPGSPSFLLELEERQMRNGPVKEWSGGRYWSPFTWYATGAKNNIKSHSPVDDSVGDYGVPKQTQSIQENPTGPTCDPIADARTVGVFDTDLTTIAENYCTQFADLMYNPWLFWSLRGWQLAIEGLAPNFMEPISYSGKTAIPSFTTASWWKYHKAANSRTVTISGVSSGVASFSAIAMPQITPPGGFYTSLSDNVWYELRNADGSVPDAWTGTVTATTFTLNAHGSITGFVAGDIGKTLIISFGWMPKYERMIRYLYPRTIFTPETNDEDEDAHPPVEEYPGEYVTEPASTTYAEYTKLGELQDSGVAPITGESARYVGDHWEAPTGRDGFEDLFFQGVPARTSDFPRFGLGGSAGSGGNGWLEDPANLFDISATPLVHHTGTGTTGSSSTILKDSALYKLWPTHITNPTPPPTIIVENQLRLSRFWSSMGGQRFVGMTLRVAVSGDGSGGNPYVWEARQIIAQNIATPSNPFVTVAPAFSATTLNRPYELDEPGYSNRGAILHRFRGVPMIITHAGGATESVILTGSIGKRLYWNTASNISAAAGDSYAIDEIEAGSVVHRKPSVAITHNGFVKPDQATQDTRGHAWFLDRMGMLQNCPTIVTNYGRLRKFDIITHELFHEMYTGLNAMRHVPGDHQWDDKGEENYRNVSGQFSSFNNNGGIPYSTATGNFSGGHSAFWSNVGQTHYPNLDNPVSICTSNIKVTGASAPPQADVEYGVSGVQGDPSSGSLTGNRGAKYHYGKVIDGNPCMANAIDFYGYGTRGALDPDEVDTSLPGGGFTRELFDAMSTLLQFRKWANWHTLPAAIGATRSTATPLGSLNAPAMPGAGPSPSENGNGAWSYANSFYVHQKKTVRRFDVPGGLRYVD